MAKKEFPIKCRVCEHEESSGSLVKHMKKQHPEIDLKEFVKEQGEEALVHPELLKKHDKSKIAVAGVSVKKRVGVDKHDVSFIPKVDKSYIFQEFTSDVLMDIQEKKPVALTGHCGTGKTSLYYQLAASIGQPVLRVNTNQQTTLSDFVGHWTVKGGEMNWVDGALPYAMKNGYWLIIDEIDYADPAILSALNAVLEPSRSLMLKEKGNEIVEAHEEFRILATGNTLGQMSEYRHLYQGTSLMNEAFLDRFRLYVVDYLKPEDEAKVLTRSIENMSERMAEKLVEVTSAIRKAFIEETIQTSFSTRKLLDWAQMIVRHAKLGAKSPMKGAESTIFSKCSREERVAIEGFINRTFFERNER